MSRVAVEHSSQVTIPRLLMKSDEAMKACKLWLVYRCPAVRTAAQCFLMCLPLQPLACQV